MAYRDDIIALGANHLYPLDTDFNDIIGALNFTNSGGAIVATQICEDATSSYRTDGTNESATAPSDPSVQDVLVDYAYSLWFMTDRIQQPPTRIFGDGGATVNNSFFLGFGNSIVAEMDADPDVIQVGSAIALVANRPYHLCLAVRDLGGGVSELEFYIDGVSQGVQTVLDTSSAARGGFRIGGITGTTTYTLGGSAFQVVSPVNGFYAMINTLVGANTPTTQQIREELFEKGALAGTTITSGLQAAMQSQVDLLAASVRPNEPLNIRIESPTFNTTDLGETADNTQSQTRNIDRTYLSSFTAAGDGVLQTGTVRLSHLTGATAESKFRVVVYEDNGADQADDLFAYSDEGTVVGTTEQQITLNFSGAQQKAIVNGTKYWIGVTIEASNTGDSHEISRGTTADRGKIYDIGFSSDYQTPPTSPLPAPDFSLDGPYDVFVTYAEGAQDITLTADDITHDPLASIHLQWMGTGTLTWINNNGSDASIVSTPNGGSVNVITPATLTISPLEPGSEVRIYEAGTQNELAGIENSGASFAASLQANSVDVVVHDLNFENIKVKTVDMSQGDVSLPISQFEDRQYENPV